MTLISCLFLLWPGQAFKATLLSQLTNLSVASLCHIVVGMPTKVLSISQHTVILLYTYNDRYRYIHILDI